MILEPSLKSASLKGYLDWTRRGRPAFWRYLVSVLLAFFVFMFLGPVIAILALRPIGIAGDNDVILFLTFLPTLIVTPMFVWLILGRPAWSVALPTWPPEPRMLIAGLAIGGILAVLPPPFLVYHYEGFGRLEAAGFSFIALSLAGLLIQTAAEEVLFRGLLMQAFHRLAGNTIVAILLQAAVFGWFHIGNIAAWHGSVMSMLPYLITAAGWGWIAARTGSLLAPWMLHFTNNASNELLFGARGDVLHSVGPVSIAPPTQAIAVLVIAMQAAISIAAVELYIARAKRRDGR